MIYNKRWQEKFVYNYLLCIVVIAKAASNDIIAIAKATSI